ncbi:MAG TPA: pitrilysin family protein [Pyrinomonadaceae bacterium]|nr:pitrilysin family protein [Pyrinomonadaceae bacterium]
MKRFFLGSLAILSIFANSLTAQTTKPAVPSNGTPAAAAAKQVYAVPFVSKTLSNGLEVIVLQDSSIPIVTVELAVRNGSFTESPEYHGLSHLYEHMFFKPNIAVQLNACESAPPLQRMTLAANPVCMRAVALKAKIGDTSYLKDQNQVSFYNGTTREEIVNYYFNTTSPYLSTAIRFINDSVRFPSFDQEDFDNEKKVVIGEIDRHEANPYTYLDLTMKQKLFYKYPTRKDPKGTRESVGTSTIEKMKTIQSRYYVPNNSALIVTGDAKPDEVFRLAEQIMGGWERRPVDPFKDFPLVEHPPLPKSEGLVIEKAATGEGGDQGQNVFIEVGWHGPSIGKDDAATYAADVFSYIISQPDSRFQRKLVDSGLSATVGFGYYTQRNVGPINLLMVTKPENAKKALAAAYAEIAAFTTPAYFTDEELESAKTILESNDLFEREKASEYAHTLGFWWSSTGIDYFRGYHAKLRAVTRADINAYIKNYIQGKNHIGIALASPEGKKLAGLTEQDLIGGAR